VTGHALTPEFRSRLPITAGLGRELTYYVMDSCRDSSLAELVSGMPFATGTRGLPAAASCQPGRGNAKGLITRHQASNLSPARRGGMADVPSLLAFGLVAEPVTTDLLPTGCGWAILGTRCSTSPEQARGD